MRWLSGKSLFVAIWLLLIGASFFALRWEAQLQFGQGATIARLSQKRGVVQFRTKDLPIWSYAGNGQFFYEENIIATGAGSAARIEFDDGRALEVRQNSQVVLSARRAKSGDQDDYVVTLLGGSLATPTKAPSKIADTKNAGRSIRNLVVKVLDQEVKVADAETRVLVQTTATSAPTIKVDKGRAEVTQSNGRKNLSVLSGQTLQLAPSTSVDFKPSSGSMGLSAKLKNREPQPVAVVMAKDDEDDRKDDEQALPLDEVHEEPLPSDVAQDETGDDQDASVVDTGEDAVGEDEVDADAEGIDAAAEEPAPKPAKIEKPKKIKVEKPVKAAKVAKALKKPEKEKDKPKAEDAMVLTAPKVSLPLSGSRLWTPFPLGDDRHGPLAVVVERAYGDESQVASRFFVEAGARGTTQTFFGVAANANEHKIAIPAAALRLITTVGAVDGLPLQRVRLRPGISEGARRQVAPKTHEFMVGSFTSLAGGPVRLLLKQLGSRAGGQTWLSESRLVSESSANVIVDLQSAALLPAAVPLMQGSNGFAIRAISGLRGGESAFLVRDGHVFGSVRAEGGSPQSWNLLRQTFGADFIFQGAMESLVQGYDRASTTKHDRLLKSLTRDAIYILQQGQIQRVDAALVRGNASAIELIEDNAAALFMQQVRILSVKPGS